MVAANRHIITNHSTNMKIGHKDAEMLALLSVFKNALKYCLNIAVGHTYPLYALSMIG